MVGGEIVLERQRKRRAQVAIEYLVLMGIVFLLIAPLIVVYYTQTTRLGEETASAAIERAATQIAEAADTVYYLGSPSTRTITVQLPENIRGVAFNGSTVIFSLSSSHGAYEQIGWSVANLTGAFGITKGPHVLVVTALEDNRVNVTER